MEKIQLNKELEKFHSHLQQNQRTILSSIFGNGKTTLLNQYMKIYSYESEFIVLHPVNYSCGTNEDIFEYIKRDILLQLSNKQLLERIDLDAIDSTLFTWDNLKDLIGFLVSLAPGGDHLQKLWEKFQPWIDKGLKVKSEYEEKATTYENYSSIFKNQRGGIYEHDVYTELIEKTLSTIQNRQQVENDSHKNKAILIIEDMDRVDPAHLFRILNVLGAHLDIDIENENKNGNKFGFDNIILVMDYYTTEHIFHHFYGKNANYNGYIQKFISHNVYHFNISDAARNELLSTLTERCSMDEDIIKALPIYVDNNGVQITIGRIIQQLSVRDIAHILDNLDNQILQDNFECNGFLIKSVAPITVLLAVIVRLNVRVHYRVLSDYIVQLPSAVHIFQQYLLSHKWFIDGNPFIIGGKHYSVAPKKTEDGTYTVDINIDRSNVSSTLNIQSVYSVYRRIFNLAMTRVLDCRQSK